MNCCADMGVPSGCQKVADDLLELDHRIDRPHEYDVADVARVHPGRQLC
jgi:hypothetical protein